ncbi:hypothetical protein [Nitrosomonas sp. Nm33]|uniref:hypothetical protein n=1 Tax=Nitrosomonas sp. Nm33 TaxID=133724 RepID=UPI00115FE387|nr:hypothetical protein [Nitrosomonas sp. Nm33]
MSSSQCGRLRAAYLAASQSDVRVVVLMGSSDFWSNGIHLNLIEHATSPADESWRNINAMNDSGTNHHHQYPLVHPGGFAG